MIRIKKKVVPSKAKASRRILRSLSEKEAIDAVLRAMKEPPLKGDIRALMKKVR